MLSSKKKKLSRDRHLIDRLLFMYNVGLKTDGYVTENTIWIDADEIKYEDHIEIKLFYPQNGLISVPLQTSKIIRFSNVIYFLAIYFWNDRIILIINQRIYIQCIF